MLDVGCSSGFFSFEFERRGARRVVGADLPCVKACEAAGLKSVESVGDFELTTPQAPASVETIGVVHARA
ncbi:MAG TPA: hypothetical protein VEI02_08420 [Planctomycetota bacterium]|nr:hypothetical protein [Planctomycetota bacterium]